MGSAGIRDEAYWIKALSNGEDAAMVYLIKQYHKSLRYFAYRMVQDADEAEDLVSDCFLKLWERRAEFKTEQNIKAFLYISCRNACLNYLQHLKVKSHVQQNHLNQLNQTEDNLLQEIIKTEVLDFLVKEIENLPEKYRQVFKLLYFDGKKTDEIAIQLNLSVKTVRNYKAIAVDLLKTTMLKKGLSGSLSFFLIFIVHKQ